MKTLSITISALIISLILIITNQVIYAQEESPPQPVSTFCAEKAESYPQCGGTLGLEDKPITETFWITRFIDCQGKIRYAEPVRLGGLGQCPQCQPETRKYPQCGGTLGLEDFPSTHTIEVTQIVGPNCQKYIIEKIDQGDLGQCQQARAAAITSSRGAATTQVGGASGSTSGNYTADIANQFGVQATGITWKDSHLKAVYNKFSQLKQTNSKYIELISGLSVYMREIYKCGQPNSYCTTPQQLNGYVEVFQTGIYENPDTFVAVLLHELGHQIYWSRPGSALRSEHENLYFNIGALTTYGASHVTENYADMIAYCLNGRAVGALISLNRYNEHYKPLASRIVGECK